MEREPTRPERSREAASEELCRELFELSGWTTGFKEWYGHGEVDAVPAYSLGYLLRKLHAHDVYFILEPLGEGFDLQSDDRNGEWSVNVREVQPEDAVAKLFIYLFEQGVLTRDGDD